MAEDFAHRDGGDGETSRRMAFARRPLISPILARNPAEFQRHLLASPCR
jgi:hypothetical protein